MLEDFQNFMKRLRKRYGKGIRFFHCGEYGERLRRPHYHALLFNFDFPDKVLFSERGGRPVFISKSLDDLWGKGFSLIGDVTFESAAYVARYITKKITGDDAEEHYQGLKPEYITMSRRPGIGKGWFDKYRTDVFPSDEVVINGMSTKPPRFYDNLLDKMEPAMLKALKMKREAEGLKRWQDNTLARLRVREVCAERRLEKLPRAMEAQ